MCGQVGAQTSAFVFEHPPATFLKGKNCATIAHVNTHTHTLMQSNANRRIYEASLRDCVGEQVGVGATGGEKLCILPQSKHLFPSDGEERQPGQSCNSGLSLVSRNNSCSS